MEPMKKEAKKLIDRLPDDATWDDLMYAIYTRQKVGDGQAAAAEGRVTAHADARKRAKKK